MSATEDRLEILIGKLLDGEISPGDQRFLDRELERDGRARELLEQMRTLHNCGCEVVGQELSAGAQPEEVFERAWRRSRGGMPRRVVRIGAILRFPVGLAAGFLLGLALHFVLVGGSRPAVGVESELPVAKDTAVGAGSPMENPMVLDPRIPNGVTREVEWYGFTDQAGNRWLIEGFREGMVRPASYRGGL